MSPKTFLVNFITLSLCFIGSSHAVEVEDENPTWPALKERYFQDRPIQENADDLLVLEAPKRAEDAAVVPVSIHAKQPQTKDTYIKNLHVFIDKNPMPYSANFHLSPTLEQVDISTRMRVDQYTYIRAIAEMNDGSLHMVSQFVKASGGCSAPAGKDQTAAMERLGKMQIRMREADLGVTVPTQVVVSHPNNSGLQMDQQTRGYIPPHYVKTMQIDFDDTPLMLLEAGISISEDPSVRFMFKPEHHGTLKAVVTDSKGQIFTSEKDV